MIKGLHHVALAVADIEAAQAFYGAAAGLQLQAGADAGLPGAPGAQAAFMLAGPNGWLRLLSSPELEPGKAPVWEAGITHFCLQSVHAHGVQTSFREAGASFHSDLIDLGTGYLYCYARDPEGNVIEIEGVAPVWADPSPWFAHLAISTADIGVLAAFYAKVLGTSAARSPRFHNNRRLDRIAAGENIALEAAWIPGPNMQIELMQYFNPPTLRRAASGPRPGSGYRYIALEVDDVAAELARLLSLGATVAQGWPEASRRHAYCADPEGNILLLLAPGADSAIAALPDPHIVARLNDLNRQITQESQL